ncbi:PilZ domain-containing protein [Pseudomonas leptonychotis]|uniref:PilZ domain-containing protein n=1 Tax=Pseudomonas leptonychotis TaxID=2448482 RepID=A0A4T1ZWH9_9PSED|nr:PilZ domain-containing protein [Pseudomonas leptonychotis]TIH07141.1 PilZ domain-containing protein [Pseudomonas leptonychotis]
MQEQALLTQAELAFIRQLNQPTNIEARSNLPLQADIVKQFSELLSHCATHEQLSLHAHIANQHLTFDLHLSQNAHSAPCLQLSAPQIFDEGAVNRAWRSPLSEPLALHTPNAQPSGLWVHQLSMNGALIEHRARRAAPKRFHLVLPLDEHTPIAIAGVFVRKTVDGFLAYQLHTLDPQSDEHLRQFIYQQHLQQEQRLASGHR